MRRRVEGGYVERGGEAGFTLLEVIVAFVIAALAIGFLYSGTTGGLLATGTSTKYEEALSLARSHLAGIGHGAAIAQQESQGPDGDGFSWRISIRPAGTRQLTLSDSDKANDTPPTSAVLYDVVVTESWLDARRTREVRLATRRFDTRAGQAGGS